MVKIALDAMGGDFGPRVVVPAALAALKKYPKLELVLVGNEVLLEKYLRRFKFKPTAQSRLTIYHASQQVGMDELPSQALRTKKDSSMRVAINLVKEKQVQACVSSGNTGALMATARFVLKTIPYVDRPAITYALPTRNSERPVRVLDLGANVDSSAEQLVQFAVMGSVLASKVGGIANPAVGLLNVGEEEIKGNTLVKKTAELLANLDGINYIGYVEGNEIFKGNVDVVVCDGFVGNIALKASEGLVRLMVSFIKDGFKKNWLTKLSGLAVLPVLKSIRKKIDPASYNGASFVGLHGIVIKSHGNANVYGFVNAIKEAMLEIEYGVVEGTSRQVAMLLAKSEEQ